MSLIKYWRNCVKRKAPEINNLPIELMKDVGKNATDSVYELAFRNDTKRFSEK